MSAAATTPLPPASPSGMRSGRVRIAGGGLAGLGLGLVLRRAGVAVTLHEAGRYPRHRVCGEFISGLSAAQLQALGLDEMLADAPRHAESTWFHRGRAFFRGTLPEPAVAVSRHELDARLAERFQALGGTLECGARTEPGGESWVAAHGRRKSGAATWLGLKAHYRGLPLATGLEMHLGRGGYAGLTQLADDTVNVCALLPSEVASGGEKSTLLPRRLGEIGLGVLAERLRAAECVAESVTGVTHFRLGWQAPAPEGSLALGDGAAMIPPFTGHGMSMAFQSALVAAPHLVRWAGGGESWARTTAAARGALRRHFAARMRWARGLHPFLLRPAGQLALVALAQARALPFTWLFHRVR